MSTSDNNKEMQKEEEKSEITKLQEALIAEQQMHMATKKELHAAMMLIQRIPTAFQLMGQGFTTSASELFNYSQAMQVVLNQYYQNFAKYSPAEQHDLVKQPTTQAKPVSEQQQQQQQQDNKKKD